MWTVHVGQLRGPVIAFLPAFRVLASKVVLERAVAATEQPQMAPPTIAGVLSQHVRIRGGGDREVDVLCDMLGGGESIAPPT